MYTLQLTLSSNKEGQGMQYMAASLADKFRIESITSDQNQRLLEITFKGEISQVNQLADYCNRNEAGLKIIEYRLLFYHMNN